MSLRYERLLESPAPLRGLLFASCLGLIFAGSFYPESMAPSSPSTALVYLMNFAHVLLYGALAVSLALALGVALPNLRATPLLVLAVGFVGWLDEWHQGTVVYRDASLWDLGSDLLGALLALLVAGWSNRPGGLRARMLPLALLAFVALSWNLLPTLAPSLPPPTP